MALDDVVAHLEDLRKRLLISIASFFFVSVICYFFSSTIIEVLIEPLKQSQNAKLIFQTPHEAFFIHLQVAGFVGFLITFPLMLFQFWLFVSPGLYPKEKKIIFPLIFVSILLFAIGAAVAFYAVIPFCLQFLLGFQTASLQPYIAIDPYFSFLFTLTITFGILFDFPVIILGLVGLRVLSSQLLILWRRWIVVAIFIVSAILTPADPVSQILLALPLLILFEITVFFSKIIERKQV